MKIILCAALMLLVTGCMPQAKPTSVSHAVVSFHEMKAREEVLGEVVAANRGPELEAKAKLATALEWEKVVAEALGEAKAECNGFISDRTTKSEKRRKWPAILMISGIVASSVIVPTLAAGNAAANSGWIAGIGGLSGGAVASSKVLESSGLSGATDARERNAVAKVFREQAAIALDPSLPVDERMRAAIKIKAECMAPEIHVPSATTG